MVGGLPTVQRQINRVRGRGTRYEVHRAASTLTHISKTLADLEGALEQREVSPPPPALFHHHRHRPRRHRAGNALAASLVAAFERISINEPEMAGSSSTSGTEGFSPSQCTLV